MWPFRASPCLTFVLFSGEFAPSVHPLILVMPSTHPGPFLSPYSLGNLKHSLKFILPHAWRAPATASHLSPRPVAVRWATSHCSGHPTSSFLPRLPPGRWHHDLFGHSNQKSSGHHPLSFTLVSQTRGALQCHLPNLHQTGPSSPYPLLPLVPSSSEELQLVSNWLLCFV